MIEKIKNSDYVLCLNCFNLIKTNELEWIDEVFLTLLELNTYCPKCNVGDELIKIE